MPNRLVESTSPYLLQHANNPVDWYPWGAEALERARREKMPIFLSIGYAACHWCHVMEHLVFERPDIAALMNANFVNIKVDREERPDLDDLYMMATQMMTGQGGWPMSVWLTPALEPFYAGTYFPPEDAHGRPGFPRLLTALADAWKNRRAALLEQAQKVVVAVREHADETATSSVGAGPSAAMDARASLADASGSVSAWLRLAVEQAADRFDDVNGGLGGAPKFPPHQHLQLWLALVAREDGALSPGEREILAGKITKTLDGMMNGGIYDHVGGGFARYSTDEQWLVPHFEKMLYDNAQLAPLYAQASVLFGRDDYARVARDTLGFFIREMMSPEGAFYSSLDADSEGVEGKYYVWTLEDVRAALPDGDDAGRVIRYFGMTAEGNWHESPVAGGSVLAVPQPGTVPYETVAPLLLKLREFRKRRERPRLDDKILTAWNGLMLSALAVTGRLLNEPAFLIAAEKLAAFLKSHHTQDGRLLRVSRGGPAHTEAFLDDYAFMLNGVMDLVDAGRAVEDGIALAARLAGTLVDDFQDKPRGGFFFTGPRHEQLFTRMKNAADNATPSPNGVAVRALLRLARHTQAESYRTAALHAVQAFHANIDRRPDYFPTLMVGLLEDAAPESLRHTHADRASTSDTHVQVAIEEIQPGNGPLEFAIRVRLDIAAGYHIQPDALPVATADFVATTVRVRVAEGNAAIATQAWKFPQVQFHGETSGYAGSIQVEGNVNFTRLEPGPLMLHLTVTAQPCTDVACLQPETVTVKIPLDAQ